MLEAGCRKELSLKKNPAAKTWDVTAGVGSFKYMCPEEHIMVSSRAVRVEGLITRVSPFCVLKKNILWNYLKFIVQYACKEVLNCFMHKGWWKTKHHKTTDNLDTGHGVFTSVALVFGNLHLLSKDRRLGLDRVGNRCLLFLAIHSEIVQNLLKQFSWKVSCRDAPHSGFCADVAQWVSS